MQTKIPHFPVFQVNRRNLSAYLSYFSSYFLIKRNFSVYLSYRVLNLIPHPTLRRGFWLCWLFSYDGIVSL
jgi:hypothetical protein